MDINTFDFLLPPELIAQEPLVDRSSSRLFFYNRKEQQKSHETIFQSIQRFGPQDVIVFNDSRVLRARLRLGTREIFLAAPEDSSSDQGAPLSCTTWNCLVHPGKFFQVGREIVFPDGTKAEVRGITENGLRQIRFHTENFAAFLEQCGEIPLPPYIHTPLSDDERYQTVYSDRTGSVAAPTAGLHFTPELLEKLRAQGVQLEFITLHVGLGTFLPVKVEKVEEHTMHSEFFTLSEEVADRLNSAKNAGKKITAVGTTVMRTLESCVEREKANRVRAQSGSTKLFLYPPAPFYIVDHLLTNFHLPKSTLLLLVSAFLDPSGLAGVEKIKELYAEAIQERYRFFSFGDAMLIW